MAEDGPALDLIDHHQINGPGPDQMLKPHVHFPFVRRVCSSELEMSQRLDGTLKWLAGRQVSTPKGVLCALPGKSPSENGVARDSPEFIHMCLALYLEARPSANLRLWEGILLLVISSARARDNGENVSASMLSTEQLVQLLDQRLQDQRWDKEETPPDYMNPAV
ncbi:hypothetical protein B0H13DRAFT_1871885 [Mycena leptocephala]|nr:hypothetical protein B0H13DRAFT_1871885 [Mycena leptocephala]